MNTGNYPYVGSSSINIRAAYNEVNIVDGCDTNKCVANVIAMIDDYCAECGIPVRLDWMDHDDDYTVTEEQLDCVLGGLTLIEEGNAQGGMSSDGEYEFVPLPGYEMDIRGEWIVPSEEEI